MGHMIGLGGLNLNTKNHNEGRGREGVPSPSGGFRNRKEKVRLHDTFVESWCWSGGFHSPFNYPLPLIHFIIITDDTLKHGESSIQLVGPEAEEIAHT